MKFTVFLLLVVVVAAVSAKEFSKTVDGVKKIFRFASLPSETPVEVPAPPMKKPSKRIVFGENVSDMSADKQKLFAHQVRLETENVNEPGYVNGCGGTLLSSRVVLTAAHCLKGIDYMGKHTDLYFGIKNLGETVSRTTVKQRAVASQYRIHTNWKKQNNNYDDIAIIILDTPVAQVPGKIEYARLPTAAISALNLENKDATISGFGLMEYEIETENLKAAKTVIRSNDACRYYPSFRAAYCICSVGRDFQNTCQGDSGGPMMYTDPATNTQYLIGVTSFGGDKCYDGSASVYTKVSSYMDWIATNSK